MPIHIRKELHHVYIYIRLNSTSHAYISFSHSVNLKKNEYLGKKYFFFLLEILRSPGVLSLEILIKCYKRVGFEGIVPVTRGCRRIVRMDWKSTTLYRYDPPRLSRVTIRAFRIPSEFVFRLQLQHV